VILVSTKTMKKPAKMRHIILIEKSISLIGESVLPVFLFVKKFFYRRDNNGKIQLGSRSG
jgi:hypothetical protein